MATRNEKIGFTLFGVLIGGLINVARKSNQAKREEREYEFKEGLGDFLLGGVVGGVAGRLSAGILGTPNDTVNYKLMDKRKVVYHGIAFDHRVENRMIEHESSGKQFTSYSFDDAKPRCEALQIEKGRIINDGPKYNIQHNS